MCEEERDTIPRGGKEVRDETLSDGVYMSPVDN